ncbi:cell division protein ZapA [Gluconacetobacter aggeris]|uniref:Cell division protein ZapA n=1 Tax=Gluconacetobacter aggeris TaxID=1286186 RepID=A0A7W4P044_9PROT|nr:cell division protein ZapA [Gluconacetobacter aggeris]MBB2169320.1 cell division protein ZapA [Gluconacetobacter aggeris]
MAQVTVRINGYAYVVGCKDGQERHLQAMALEVERRIEHIRAIGGQSGEARILALAALLMADEIHDLSVEKMPADTARQLAEGRQARVENERRREQLALLVERAESIAAALEHP